MSEIHHAAAVDGSPGGRTSRAVSDVNGLSALALRSVRVAREALDGVDVLGPTRFALPKRVLLRVSRLFTHKLVHAGRALADALEAMAVVQRDQVAYVQRMNDSVSALVVSADLAITDTVDRLSEVVDAPPAGQGIEAQVALLGARLAELERTLASDQVELARLRAVVEGLGGKGARTQVASPQEEGRA